MWKDSEKIETWFSTFNSMVFFTGLRQPVRASLEETDAWHEGHCNPEREQEQATNSSGLPSPSSHIFWIRVVGRGGNLSLGATIQGPAGKGSRLTS